MNSTDVVQPLFTTAANEQALNEPNPSDKSAQSRFDRAAR